MKVLHVISDRNVGGAGVLLCNLLRELPGLGVESLVALPEESLLCDRIRELGVRTVELRYPVDRVWLRSVGEVVRLLRAERPDLLHANAALSARISARLTGTPVVHTRHCYYPEEKETGALACFLNRRLSDLSIATAESAAENLRSLGIPRERIRCIPNGSNPVREVRREELSSFYAQAGLAESDLCIGICARLVPCKGHRCFLLAAHLLRQRLPELPLRFLIAGEGSERRALEELSETLGLAPFVRFLGFLEDPAPFYRALTVNVNCSVGTETSCLALSEGMSASLPTVASDYGGNAAMLDRGRSAAGILFPAGDARALAGALERILTDPCRRERMQRAARERYEKHYTATRMAEATVAVYRELLESKHRRG